MRLKGSPLCHLSLVRGKVAATMKAFLVALVLLASIVMIALRLLRGRIRWESAGPTGKARFDGRAAESDHRAEGARTRAVAG